MSYLPEFFAVVIIHLLATMSPGPDFVMVSKNSVTHSRRAGIYSAIGVGLGILVHVTYSLIGIGLIISRSIVLFSIIKYIGAGYLIYIGWRSLRAKPYVQERTGMDARSDMRSFVALRMGFLTNALNPKATLFFLALFTQVIDPRTPLFVQALYGLEMATMTCLWFLFVAVALSHPSLKERFISIGHRLEQVFGVVLIALGVKVALSSTK